jgi:hypothetical protein
MHIVTRGVAGNAPYQRKGGPEGLLVAMFIGINLCLYCCLDFAPRACLHAPGTVLLHGMW